jgi:hypothetical protein
MNSLAAWQRYGFAKDQADKEIDSGSERSDPLRAPPVGKPNRRAVPREQGIRPDR